MVIECATPAACQALAEAQQQAVTEFTVITTAALVLGMLVKAAWSWKMNTEESA